MKWLALCIVVVGMAAGLGWVLRPRPVVVQTATAQRGSLVRAMDEDGTVRSETEVKIAPLLAGRLQRRTVARGSRVTRGQLLAELDNAELRTALSALEAQARGARAALSGARSQANTTRARLQREEQLAAAGLELSRAQQGRVNSSARPEELETARLGLERARLKRSEAERDLARRQRLFAGGAVSRSDLELYQSGLRNAQLAQAEAETRWRQLRVGAAGPERAVASSEVSRAAANLELARSQEGQADASLAAALEAEQRVAALDQQVEGARARLEQTRLRAPAAGVVEWEDVPEGETVQPGQTLGRLLDPSQLYVELLVDEGDRGQIHTGIPVRVTCDAYPDASFTGKLVWIEAQAYLKRQLRNSPTQDEDRVFRARVKLAPSRQALYPGMSVFVQVVLGERKDVLTVPRQACVNRESRWLVYRVKNGRAETVPIELGDKDRDRLEVRSGLAAGDVVVVNPGTLADGQHLQVAP